MITVYVPSFHKIEDASSSYTVFRIEVVIGRRCHILEKRYSEFEDLHKQLKKVIKTPDFPPKKVLNRHPKVLEQRRQMFQTYLQDILDSGKIPKSLISFLGISLSSNDKLSLATSIDSLDQLSGHHGICHQPVIAFKDTMFKYHQQRGGLPDIVTQGVVDAIYRTK
ncbi:sorting nexin-24-like [Lineus longissimus]|uniref:sorting nexin-24-like n=1 Tax=Lineus longissimus TaxID=88925 RepID=UPI002B4F93D6